MKLRNPFSQTLSNKKFSRILFSSLTIPAMAAGLLATGVGEAQAVSIILDDFSDPTSAQATLPVTSDMDTTLPTPGDSIFGNATRKVTVNVTSGAPDFGITVATQACPKLSAPNCLSYSADSGVTGNFQLQYTGFGGVNLAAGGNDTFRVVIDSTDLPSSLTFQVTDTIGGFAEVTDIPVPFFVGVPGFNDSPFNLDIDFNSLTGVDLTQVDSLSFNFNAPNQQTDLAFSFISVEDTQEAPEPLTILGSITAVGIGAAFKKKQAAKSKQAS